MRNQFLTAPAQNPIIMCSLLFQRDQQNNAGKLSGLVLTRLDLPVFIERSPPKVPKTYSVALTFTRKKRRKWKGYVIWLRRKYKLAAEKISYSLATVLYCYRFDELKEVQFFRQSK